MSNVKKPASGMCWAVIEKKVPDGRRAWSWSFYHEHCSFKARKGCLTCGHHKKFEEEAIDAEIAIAMMKKKASNT